MSTRILALSILAAGWARAQTPAASPGDEHAAGIKYDKGFILSSGDGRFETKLGIRAQARIEVSRPDARDEFESAFLVPRLRLQLEGFAFGEDNLYKVEFDMANRGSAALKDFFFEHVFLPALRLRVGQWKRPFSRQEIVSDFGSEFLERSIANTFGGSGRDIGVALHNNYEKSPDGLEWALGAFNSDGERARQTLDCEDPTDITTCVPTTPSNVPEDFGPMLVARVGWNAGGIKGYSEGDLEGGPLRLAVGASYGVDLNDFEDGRRADAAEIDAMLKLYGASLSAAFYVRKDGSDSRRYGFYAQPGYFVVPRRLELAARFARIDDEDAAQEHEILGAVDWYFDGHAFKWMTDGGILHSSASDETDVQIRTQVQVLF